jgi:hypothetical protein
VILIKSGVERATGQFWRATRPLAASGDLGDKLPPISTFQHFSVSAFSLSPPLFHPISAFQNFSVSAFYFSFPNFNFLFN